MLAYGRSWRGTHKRNISLHVKRGRNVCILMEQRGMAGGRMLIATKTTHQQFSLQRPQSSAKRISSSFSILASTTGAPWPAGDPFDEAVGRPFGVVGSVGGGVGSTR